MPRRKRTLNLTTRIEAPKDNPTLQRVIAAYEGSDGNATIALYDDLRKHGPAGQIAINLFRACKCSARAKVYRGGGHKREAYDRKQWSIGNLGLTLTQHPMLTWGWKVDPSSFHVPWVLYIDLPEGQASFHTEQRGLGPDYAGDWDGAVGTGPARICRFAANVLEGCGMAVGRKGYILKPAATDRKRGHAEATMVQSSLPF